MMPPTRSADFVFPPVACTPLLASLDPGVVAPEVTHTALGRVGGLTIPLGSVSGPSMLQLPTHLGVDVGKIQTAYKGTVGGAL